MDIVAAPCPSSHALHLAHTHACASHQPPPTQPHPPRRPRHQRAQTHTAAARIYAISTPRSTPSASVYPPPTSTVPARIAWSAHVPVRPRRHPRRRRPMSSSRTSHPAPRLHIPFLAARSRAHRALPPRRQRRAPRCTPRGANRDKRGNPCAAPRWILFCALSKAPQPPHHQRISGPPPNARTPRRTAQHPSLRPPDALRTRISAHTCTAVRHLPRPRWALGWLDVAPPRLHRARTTRIAPRVHDVDETIRRVGAFSL